MRKINIAIDGYSSCGKSTLAKGLAKALNYNYIDTGAMYRAIALHAIRTGLLDDDRNIPNDKIEPVLPDLKVLFHINPDTGRSEVYLNDEPVEQHIRTIEVAEVASKISKHRAVRNKLQAVQREMASHRGVIMDGRDIGTVVMPDAELKLFMTADPEVRAVRRYKELQAKGRETSLEDVRKNQAERDYEDENRKEDPLRKAEDALTLDNTELSEPEQLKWVIKQVQELVNMPYS